MNKQRSGMQWACRYMAAKAELAGIESKVLAMAQEQDAVSMSGVGILALSSLHCDSNDYITKQGN